MMISTKVGALACQRDPYLKELTALVVSCEALGGATCKEETSPLELYEVVLSDTVLFPEGGGQPCDYGTIADLPVTTVVRRGDTCVHTVKGRAASLLAVGQEVVVQVDWTRRIDHMWHHTGQHVVTAVFENLGFPTESWSLTHPFCYIQVPVKKDNPIAGDEILATAEAQINDLIARNVRVVTTVYDTREDLPPNRSRGIPKDVTGPIRMVEVEGVDACACCGTHVRSVGEMGILKVLHAEKGRIFFIVGPQRVGQYFAEMYLRERSLSKALSTAPDTFLSTVDTKTKQLMDATKKVKNLQKELSELLAPGVAASCHANTSPIFFFYREDVDVDFTMRLAEEILRVCPGKVAVLGVGPKTGEGQFVVCAPESELDRIGGAVGTVLEAKGIGKVKGILRGKCNMKKWKDLVKKGIA